MEDYKQQEVNLTVAPKNAAEEIAQIELKIKKAQLADLELQSRERELTLTTYVVASGIGKRKPNSESRIVSSKVELSPSNEPLKKHSRTNVRTVRVA